MKIISASCKQFAGVRDRSVAFTDGINVIYGKNESGKSTLVNLISRTLFQPAKLDRRKDKDFYESFFLAAKKGVSFTADFVDGIIAFETEKGVYTLEKEWGSDARCVLSTPDGVLRDVSSIAEKLREVLVYGEGVYANMLLSSQRNTDHSLQTILDVSKKNNEKQEIADAVSQAFSESNGISTDAIEAAIYAKIAEIAGKHWDSERMAPKKRTAGRWTVAEKDLKKDKLLRAYYELEDAQNVRNKITNLEQDVEKASSEYAEKDLAARDAEEAFRAFNGYASKLMSLNERKKHISDMKSQLDKMREILSRWPILTDELKKAKMLEEELTNSKTLDLYTSAKELHDKLAEQKAKAADMLCPESGEISAVKTALRKVTTLENKLCSMNLTAAIKMLDGHQMEIKSLRTGETISATEATSITEAVSITIPGVMEMQLAPADVDVGDIEHSLSEEQLIIQNIFKKYSVATLDELENISQDYKKLQSDIDKVEVELNASLGDTPFEDVEEKAASVTRAPRSEKEIRAEIHTLCGSMDIFSYIVSRKTMIKSYEDDYKGIAELGVKVSDLQAELEKARNSVSDMENIPAEFAEISDPEAYLEKLQKDWNTNKEDRDEALHKKIEANADLENYKETIAGDPLDNVEKAKREFAEQKALLAHWTHIAEIFEQQKENITDNPLVDLAENFTRYLGVISGGKVASEFPDIDKLNMNIYSSDRLIDYGKLSEGTK